MNPTELSARHDLINDWIAAANAFDTDKWVSLANPDAQLHDPGVGDFAGAAGLSDYFTTYFIGYKTATRIISIADYGDRVHVDVHFTGTFPGGAIGGVFDLTFTGRRISRIDADLT